MLTKFQFTLAENLAAQVTALQSGQHRGFCALLP
jgi:hypothetical protein